MRREGSDLDLCDLLCPRERRYKLSEVRAAVCKSVPCYTTELSWPPANDTNIAMTCSKQSGFTHHFQGLWVERCQLQTVCCRIPEQECWGIKQDYTSDLADSWGVKKAQDV